jgi:hypothetical protein
LPSEITRRNFMKGSTVTAAVPFFIKADRKSGNRLPVTGVGEHEYECSHNWGDLPSHIRYGNTHGVCEDSNGHIYIHHTVHASSQSADTIVVFDSKGKFVRSFGPQYKDGAHGLHLRKEGHSEFLYICDQVHSIVTKRTLTGEEVWTLGYPNEAAPYERTVSKPGLAYRPTNVAIASNGDIYVADGYGSNYVNQYDQNAKYIRSFGGNGTDSKEPGSLSTPHGLMVDNRSNPATLLVADRANNRIQRFTLDGKHIEFISGTNRPCHFHERGGVVVVPDLANRATLLGPDNKVLTHLCDSEYSDEQRGKIRLTETRANFEPGKFVCPHGAIFDHTGNIFVVEYVVIGRVTKLRKLT